MSAAPVSSPQSTGATRQGDARVEQDGFSREIRFAVVMYGGVSLSVYINGIAQELFALVRATAPSDGDPLTGRFRFANDELSGTERVYRELGRQLQARFVVDILSGTSAGGINALYLAKALVHNRSLEGFKRLWVEEADIAKLLNDRESLSGLSADLVQDPPESVLNGQRFYRKLLDALESMDDAPQLDLAGSDASASETTDRPPYVDELDLFTTATDFEGVKRELRLFDKTIVEPHHRKLFRFRYDHSGARDDFARGINPFLAFAARCTASFPAAFPPFKLEDIDPILGSHPHYRHQQGVDSSSERWQRFFEEYPPGYEKRYFVDGGYLDNKPFEAVVRAVAERRRPLLPVDRKLIYIEPHPEEFGGNRESARPDVIKALLAVASLPRVETIRAEVDELNRRNRVITRASILTDGLEEDWGEGRQQDGRPRPRQLPAALWALAELKDMVEEYGVAYGGYHRLKVSGLTDWLASCCAGPTPPSRALSGSERLRRLIAAWREWAFVRYYNAQERADWDSLKAARKAKDPTLEQVALRQKLEQALGTGAPHAGLGLRATQNRFLVDFDLGYRLRRIEFERLKLREVLESQAKAEAVLALARCPTTPAAGWFDARDELVQLQGKLQAIHQELLGLSQSCSCCLGPEERQQLERLGDELARVEDAGHEATIAETADDLLGRIRKHLKRHFTEIGRRHEQVLDQASGADPASLVAATLAALRNFHDRFAELDLVRFTVLYTMGTDELDPIEVIRISAEDTKLAGSRGVEKLAGVQFGHFGAFFDADWRKNDILWGRLDAAERLITALAPAGDAAQSRQREAWLVDAFTAIIREELAPYTRRPERVEALTRRLVERLQKAPPSKKKDAKAAKRSAGQVEPVARAAIEMVQDKRWAEIEQEPHPKKAKTKIAAYLTRRARIVRLDDERALTLLSRATRVVRGVIESVAVRRSKADSRMVKGLTSLLGAVWAVIELGLPGVEGLVFRRALGLVTLTGFLLALLGTVTDNRSEVGMGAALAGGALFLLVAGAALRAATRGTARRFQMVAAAVLSAGSFVAAWLLHGAASFPPAEALEATPAAAAGPTMVDFQLAQTPDRMRGILESFERTGVVEQVRSAIYSDFWFILAYVTLLASVMWLLSTLLRLVGLDKGTRLAGFGVVAAFAAGVCDLIENALLLAVLDQRLAPFLETHAAALVTFPAFGVACLKFGLVFLILIAAAVMLVVLVVRALLRAPGPARSPTP